MLRVTQLENGRGRFHPERAGSGAHPSPLPLLPLCVTVVAVPGGTLRAHQEASLPIRDYDATEERGEVMPTSGLGVGAGGGVPWESGQVGGGGGGGP